MYCIPSGLNQDYNEHHYSIATKIDPKSNELIKLILNQQKKLNLYIYNIIAIKH